MSLEIIGTFHDDLGTQEISDRFKRRDFIIETTEEVNGKIHKNYVKFQLVNTKAVILDRFTIGDTLKVVFNLKGKSFVDRKDGQTKYITNLDAWRVELATEQTS